MIYGKLKRDISQILIELYRRKGVEILEAEACADHIQMLITVPSKYDSAAEENQRISERLEITERELSAINRVNADYDHLQDLVAKQSKELAEAQSKIKSLSVELQGHKDQAAQQDANLNDIIETKDQIIKTREKDTRMLVERYENVLSTQSDSLMSLIESLNEYASSVSILSESILVKHTHFIPEAQQSQDQAE